MVNLVGDGEMLFIWGFVYLLREFYICSVFV